MPNGLSGDNRTYLAAVYVGSVSVVAILAGGIIRWTERSWAESGMTPPGLAYDLGLSGLAIAWAVFTLVLIGAFILDDKHKTQVISMVTFLVGIVLFLFLLLLTFLPWAKVLRSVT
jgi:inner membrane protein involved in colicin E2 resistance